MTFYVDRILTHSKDGNVPSDNQDAVRYDCLNGKFAVADGVFEGQFCKLWAELLCQAFLRPEVDFIREHDEIAVATFWDVLPSLRDEWRDSIPWSRLPYYVPSQSSSVGFSTFIGAQARLTTGSQRLAEVRVLAVGDACLFHFSGRRMVYSFPLKTPEEFGFSPSVIASADSPRFRYSSLESPSLSTDPTRLVDAAVPPQPDEAETHPPTTLEDSHLSPHTPALDSLDSRLSPIRTITKLFSRKSESVTDSNVSGDTANALPTIIRQGSPMDPADQREVAPTCGHLDSTAESASTEIGVPRSACVIGSAKFARFEILPGDALVLCTDAVAKWILSSSEEAISAVLDADDELLASNLLREVRSKAIRNDDFTLMRVRTE